MSKSTMSNTTSGQDHQSLAIGILTVRTVLGNDHLTWRAGGLWFFSKKNILILNVAEKNILILVEEKKNGLIQFLSYNLMLNSGKKFRASS